MKIVFISGPYRAKTKDGIQKNIDAAAKVAKKYWKEGYAVICPHMNSAHFSGVAPETQFLDACIEFIRHSDLVVMMKDWSNSEGARKEHWAACMLDKEIIYE